jgi:hypothetical protein
MNIGMAQPKPAPRQGLRANHRLRNRVAVHRINPALYTSYRKSMKLHEIFLNQTLKVYVRLEVSYAVNWIVTSCLLTHNNDYVAAEHRANPMKKFLLGFTILLGSVTLLPNSVLAAEIDFKSYDDFDLISISGEIEEADVAHFQRLAISSSNAVVVIESPGGALAPALKIGEIIRLKGFSTYVPNNVTCTSSCALIWVAGQRRLLATTGRVGFHASYVTVNGAQRESGLGNALVGRYLTLLNLPEKAILFATSAGPDKVMWISTSAPQESGIDFEIFDLAENNPPSSPNEAMANSNGQIPEFKWERDGWTVLSNNAGNGCFMILEFNEENGRPNKSNFSISVELDGSAFLSFSNEKFKSVKNGVEYQIELLFVTGEKVDTGWGKPTFYSTVHEDGVRSLTTPLDWAELRLDIRDEETVAFIMDNKIIDVYRLKSSARAMQELDRCLSSAIGGLDDPFAVRR